MRENDAPIGGGCQECYYTKLKLLGGLAMGIWEQLLLEPRSLTIVGLAMDLIGGTLIAFTAWFRLSFVVVPLPTGSGVLGVTGIAQEPGGALKWRRVAVVVGVLLLGLGFGLQMFATWLQIP